MDIFNSVKFVHAAEVNLPAYPDEVFTKEEAVINLRDNGLKIGDVFSGLLEYIIPLAGIVLLVMLIVGGLGLMTAAGNPDKIKAGYGRITSALIGFLIIFISYFIVQLVEVMLGVGIL